MTAPELRAIKAWHEALNSGDADRVVALSQPNVEVGGPRGAGPGAGVLRKWVGRANIHLERRRVFHKVDTVVVEQRAGWRSTDAGQATGSQTVASLFVVQENQIAKVLRYDDLASALSAGNLGESNETQLG
ncbi:MAG TPA: nuclear transport factor 2 family protein [Rubrobacteraceae bacterium]|nr:nuclear transport factor 2 family protein [Rubrobacteraceae bacterium]